MRLPMANKHRIPLLLIFLLCSAAAGAQEYALVLAGGGGKGAYQVGVWKALTDYGIAQKVTAISGTSVGGLNAALFACADVKQAERIWKEQVPSCLTKDDALISQEGLQQIIGSIDLSAMQRHPFPRVTVTAVRNRYKILKALTVPSPGEYAHRFTLNDEGSTKEIAKELLATSAFPVICQPVELADGYRYIDGGAEALGGDNVPVAPVLQECPSVSTIIVVYLDDEQHISRRIKKIDYDAYSVLEIIPSINLSRYILEGTTNFTENRIQLLITQGYEDTAEVLRKQGLYPVSSWWFE